MIRFKAGDKVKHQITGRTYTILGETRWSKGYRPCYWMSDGVNHNHLADEYFLIAAEPICPVCNNGVKIENHKISKHDINDQTCYGSFMPTEGT